jgi:hypothetical protein
MVKNSLFIAVGLVTILFSCAPKTVEVATVKEAPKFPTTEIAEGSTLYQENCGKCHKLKVVSNFSAVEWKSIVPRMAKKAKLDAASESKVMAYVLWQTENK